MKRLLTVFSQLNLRPAKETGPNCRNHYGSATFKTWYFLFVSRPTGDINMWRKESFPAQPRFNTAKKKWYENCPAKQKRTLQSSLTAPMSKYHRSPGGEAFVVSALLSALPRLLKRPAGVTVKMRVSSVAHVDRLPLDDEASLGLKMLHSLNIQPRHYADIDI